MSNQTDLLREAADTLRNCVERLESEGYKCPDERAFLAKIDAMPAGEGEESEFQVISGCDEDACIEAATSGPRDVALREAMRYAHQYAEDGHVKVVELVTVAMLAASGRQDGAR